MIYLCINLPRSSDRRIAAEAEFNREGLDVRFVQGFDGRRANLRPGDSYCRFGYTIPPGCVGNILSWFTALQIGQQLAGPNEPIVILEDDVRLVAEFESRLLAAVLHAPADWDVIYPGHCCLDGSPPEVSPGLVAGMPLCTHAVMIHHSAIPAFLEAASVVVGPVDCMFRHLVLPRLKSYCCVPSLVTQSGLASTINPQSQPFSWGNVQGWMDESVRYVYDFLVGHFFSPKIVEVGVWRGQSLIYLAQQFKRLGRGAHLYGVDTFLGTAGDGPQPEIVSKLGGTTFFECLDNLTAAGVRDLVTLIPEPSTTAAGRFTDAELDAVFIDGDHSYEAVRADIAAWAPKVKPGGVLCGHDYDRDDVRRAVADAFSGRTVEVIQPRCWLTRA